MKIRANYVSNSSSASFLLDLATKKYFTLTAKTQSNIIFYIPYKEYSRFRGEAELENIEYLVGRENDSNTSEWLTLSRSSSNIFVSLYFQLSSQSEINYNLLGKSMWIIQVRINLSPNYYIKFRSKKNIFITTPFKADEDFYPYFKIINADAGGQIEASGNIGTLFDMDDGSGNSNNSYYTRCFYKLFKDCKGLISAPELPAITAEDSCCESMFEGCESLINVPDLSLTSLAPSCCFRMFAGCKSLINAPKLPKNVLADSCYKEMFSGCILLENTPELPATTLTSNCYESMFASCTSLSGISGISGIMLNSAVLSPSCCFKMFTECTSLKNAPNLPINVLVDSCYKEMFSYCTLLENRPELPATNLALNCYEGMFMGCSSLTNGGNLPAQILIQNCYKNMFKGCTSLSSLSVEFNTWAINGRFSGTESDYRETAVYWLNDIEIAGEFRCPEDLPVTKRNANSKKLEYN